MSFFPATVSKVRHRRPPQWTFPRSLERKFVGQLSSIFGEALKDSIRRNVISRLPELVAKVELHRPARRDSLRADAWPDDVARMRDLMTQDLSAANILVQTSASSIAVDLYRQNRNQWGRIQKAMLGVEAVGENEAWASEALTSWVNTNVNLITKLSTDVATDVEGIVSRGLQSGLRVEEITQELIGRKTGELGIETISRNRARFIARDQISKLNGQITQARQTELGVERYVWRTSQDERVRPSHRVLEGRTCLWNNASVVLQDADDPTSRMKRSSLSPTGYVGHPGSDYQCRCYPEPVLEDVLGEPL